MNTFARVGLIFFVVLIASLCVLSQGKPVSKGKPQLKPLSAQEIAKRFLPSVVLIVCDDGKGKVSQGSGFFIGDGKILTNYHVVESMVRGKAKVAVGGKNAREWWIQKVLQVDRELDLALLEIKPTTVEVLGYGDEKGNIAKKINDKPKMIDPGSSPLIMSVRKMSIGERIYVLSNPQGLAGSLSQGIVSGEIRKVGKVELLQFDAPISAGSSGGAILNTNGEVAGIVNSTLSNGQNLNFGVPSVSILSFLLETDWRQLVNPFTPASPVDNSWSRKGSALGSGLGSGLATPKVEEKVTSKLGERKDKPTLEETTLWIADKLHNTKPSFNRRIETLRFRGCEMTFKDRYIGGEGFETVSTYSTTLTRLESVEKGVGRGFDEKVFLEFNQNFDEEKVIFYLGKPYSSEQTKTARIVIFTQDSEMGKRVQEAFLRLKEICSVEVTEPF